MKNPTVNHRLVIFTLVAIALFQLFNGLWTTHNRTDVAPLESYESVEMELITCPVPPTSFSESELPEESSHPADDAPPNNITPAPDVYIELTEAEIHMLATLVYLEVGIEPYECQTAVASVVINRVTTSNCSLEEVIYAKDQFSPAHDIPYNTYTESTLRATLEVVKNGPTIPEYVTYFRAGYYHDWSSRVVPYRKIGHTYFSYDVDLKAKVK